MGLFNKRVFLIVILFVRVVPVMRREEECFFLLVIFFSRRYPSSFAGSFAETLFRWQYENEPCPHWFVITVAKCVPVLGRFFLTRKRFAAVCACVKIIRPTHDVNFSLYLFLTVFALQ